MTLHERDVEWIPLKPLFMRPVWRGIQIPRGYISPYDTLGRNLWLLHQRY